MFMGQLDQGTSLMHPSLHHADESTASILKSVKAQEVQFEQLTRNLEAERESKVPFSTPQPNHHHNNQLSMTSMEDSYQWRSPQPLADSQFTDSFGDSKMSSHLLDSCLRELDHRGNMDFGDDRPDYHGDDRYAGGYPYSGYHEGDMSPGALNGGNPQYQDHRSPHASQLSLHSTGSNRGQPRMHGQRSPGYQGSMSSLPRDHHDNYMSHHSLQHQGAPDSPLGSDSPHRLQYSTQPTYNQSQYSHENSPRYSLASNDSFQRPQQHYDPYVSHDQRNLPSRHDDYGHSPEPSGPMYGSQQQMTSDPRYGNNPPYDQQGDPYRNPNYNDSQNDSFYADTPNRYGNPRPGAPMDPPSRNDSYRHPQDDYRDGPPPDDRYSDVGYGDEQNRSYDEDPYRRGHPDDDPYGRQNPDEDPYGRHNPDEDPYRRQNPNYGESPAPGHQGYPPEDQLRDLSLHDGPRGQPDESFPEQPSQDSYGYAPPSQTYGDYDDHPYAGSRKHEGLPPVHSDPFADDPFQKKLSQNNLYQTEDPYRRGPSPGAESDRYAGSNYNDPSRPYGHDPYQDRGPEGVPGDMDMSHEMRQMAPPPNEEFMSDGRRTPSVDVNGMGLPWRLGHYGTSSDLFLSLNPMNSETSSLHAPQYPRAFPPEGGSRLSSRRSSYGSYLQGGNWRNPDLQEIIDFLSHPSDAVKANAAAYLQHLCYNNDDIKAKTRSMDGIPQLIELLKSEFPEVQRNACGALKNLSYGRTRSGLDNKKAIEKAGGVTALIRLLRKVHEEDEDIKELITGILWNLSSCEDLKWKIIQECLTDIVSRVIVPYSGWEKRLMHTQYQPWTTVFKNATGIVRNLTSAARDDEQKGYEIRNRLRECSKLVNCLVYALKQAVDNNDKDNKPVENCTCALRNLSFRIQEVAERDFYKKRTMTLKKRQHPEKDTIGCLGGGNKKKTQGKKGKPDQNQNAEQRIIPGAQEFKALWEPEVVRLYLSILKDGSNPVTVEAAAGAIQNLTACYWTAADDIRALVRREKGLPDLVYLLTHDRDTIVCHTALALRNLAIDSRNKELIGKHAMRQLIGHLPQPSVNENIPDRTIVAVMATLHEVTKDNQDFAMSFAKEGGLQRLAFVKTARNKYAPKTKEHAHTLLLSLWEFKQLHPVYNTMGVTEAQIKGPVAQGRPEDVGSPMSNYSTMSRPMASQGYDDNTLSPGRTMDTRTYNSSMNGRLNDYSGSNAMLHGHSNPSMHNQENYYDPRERSGNDIPLQDMPPPGYAPLEGEPRTRVKPPAGAVSVFPGLDSNSRQQSQTSINDVHPVLPNEQLYAQVDRTKKRNPGSSHMMLDMGAPGSPQGGADSWV